MLYEVITHDRSEQLATSGIVERQHAASQRVHQTVTRCLHRLAALRDVIVEHVVGDIYQCLVRCWTFSFAYSYNFV